MAGEEKRVGSLVILLLTISYITVGLSQLIRPDPPRPYKRVTPTIQVAASGVKYNDIPNKPTVKANSPNPPYNPVGISLHGGVTMQNGSNIYIIWYGNWSETQKQPIRNFFSSLGPQNPILYGSLRAWWNINSFYYSSNNQYTAIDIAIVKEVNDNYSQGKDVSNYIYSILWAHLNGNNVPKDKYGQYLILTSDDVVVRL